ncbi:MAG: DUF1615 family protein [Candidatus Saccharibacteria bacterium]|nr:DUF1615 family protein [Moraxellaceae bacterium]
MRYLPLASKLFGSKSALLIALSCAIITTGCEKKTVEDPDLKLAEKDKVARLIPARAKDRKSWATDILAIMDEANYPHSLENICTIVAIVDQESNFQADPAVAGLSRDAKKTLFERVQDKLGDIGLEKFKEMLKNKPTPEDSFMMKINKIKTERDLDLMYREMFDYFKDHYNLSVVTGAASLLAGLDIKEYLNPIKTLGSMQVHVNYAFSHAQTLTKKDAIRDDMYTQYGGMYYGINRLLGYDADYDKPIYRFADYNSGVYSSRNAAFQQTISKLSDIPLTYDGDMLSYDKDKKVLATRSNTESQIEMVVKENKLNLSNANIRGDLLKEKDQEFEDTEIYKKINILYSDKFNKEPPYAIMPNVEITGPKLSRDYNTNWYANRVNGRYLRCASNAKRLGFQRQKTIDAKEENSNEE